MKQSVYFDNAATTPITPPVLEAMLPWLKQGYGNASSIYALGREAQKALTKSREKIAAALNAEASEIYFTGGGSEADNWAVKSYARHNSNKGKHLVTSTFEHHAVLYPMAELEKEGFEVTYLEVNADGVIRAKQLKKAMRQDTILVSVMLANNEIGTIQPIKELAAIAHAGGAAFHTDAVQAVGHIPLDLKDLNVDMLSLSGHKFHGPKGVGALYLKKGVFLPPYISGGAQERNRRAGTENIASIVGMSKALELAVANLAENTEKITTLRDRLVDGVLKNIPYTRFNGGKDKRLPGNANFSFEYVEGESILLMLDSYHIAASSGSACTSGSLDPSHVLLAIGLPHEIAHGSLRLTLSEENTDAEVDFLLEVLPKVIGQLREMSPLYENLPEK